MARKKDQQPSRTMLQKEAAKCLFNPRETGPMKVIADTGDVKYYETRAVEAIYQAQLSNNTEAACEQLRQAVSLLLLSLAKRSSNG